MMSVLRRPSASTRQRERGAGLVVIMGVIAALAISAATLVAFTVNVQHNTSDTRMRTKSFTVCEAGLDAGMSLLGHHWPTSASVIPTFDTTGFRDRFSTTEFPNPSSGSFITVDWYDNLTPIGAAIRYDSQSPPDGRMWMVSQANVGSRSTRVLSLVELTWMTMALPRGIPLWAGGDLLSNGQGNNPKIEIEVPPPPNESGEVIVTVQVGGEIEQPSVTGPGITQTIGPDDISPLEQVFPQALVDALKSTAQANGRYFTSLTAAEASSADAVWSPTGGISGLTVIEPPVAGEVRITGNEDVNTEAEPGILLVLGGSGLVWGGNAQFYGVIYTEGQMDTANGTSDIHGMVVTNNTEDMRGTPNILYNDNAIANLDHRFPSMVRRVPNTWREIKPL